MSDPIKAIEKIVRRTGQGVVLTATPWVSEPGAVQWIVSATVPGPVCLGSSTDPAAAVAKCAADVERALGVTEYPKGKEG